VPALATSTDSTGAVTLYASWNGATGVASWQVSLGPTPTTMSPVTTAPSIGFETAIALGAISGYTTVTAIDSTGRMLATSQPVAV